MIGVVGSADSTARLQRVAADLSMSDQVLVRSYDRLEQAADLAAELDGVCNVLLFTGLVPYELTRERDPGLHSRGQYVPHGRIDLYRTLALLLSERQGSLPRMSIDTIPAARSLRCGFVVAGPSWRWRSCHDGAVGTGDLTREPRLDVLPQPGIGNELGSLRSPSGQVGLPLRHRRPVLPLPAAGGGVAPKLTRDRSRVASDLSRDLAYALALGPERRDLLVLDKR
jgi:hypothetical protein